MPSASAASDGVPAHRSIGAEFLSLDEGQFAMSKFCQVLQRERGGSRVIENNVCHSGHIAVTETATSGT